ncbi:hypothetical protein CBM2589_B170063 [Cupriavidus taiwanensis]|uniref:Uncharacterized protein n=1 Tax=Cupriavidus taiwanensis TaxID=164546 RepID=A0A975WWU3_9BURK|nr:hypothetical protein CBM2589_B170063 [Cupriavidus taiwanensis]
MITSARAGRLRRTRGDPQRFGNGVRRNLHAAARGRRDADAGQRDRHKRPVRRLPPSLA